MEHDIHPPLLPGELLGGRYRIVRALGAGGMGKVYLAEDLKLPGKRWAVKQIPAGVSGPPPDAEAATLMRLEHPYLPHIVDYFPPQRDGCGYLVMEYIEGENLHDRFVRSGNRLPVETVLSYAIQLCDLLHYLHNLKPNPIVYRDLKPSNLMVDGQDHIRLIDFGIARRHKPGQNADTAPLGTIGFASPEQIAMGRTDIRSDLYSLGAVIYYLLSGGKHFRVTPKPFAALHGRVPERLIETLRRLLEEKPDNRFQTALEARKHLERCLSPLRNVVADSGKSDGAGFAVLPRTIIVVGGLYRGAGATFVALALAKLLDGRGIPHAVIEHPTQEPELFALLCGDRRAPPDCAFIAGNDDQWPNAGTKWVSGHTEWLPLHPETTVSDWPPENVYRIMGASNRPVTIVDIGDRWLYPAVRALCESADTLVAVADPYPAKWASPTADRSVRQLMEWHDAGKSVHFVANKDVGHRDRNDWLRSFPLRPRCVIPAVAHERVVGALWAGRLPHAVPGVGEKLVRSLEPLIAQSLPATLTTVPRAKRGGLLARWLQIDT